MTGRDPVDHATHVDLVVVGGGISGLAAAWEAVLGGATVAVLEAGDRFGGRIRTSALSLTDGEVPIDEGADAFLARSPGAVELCRELGLDADLVEPATGRARVWIDGELRPLPEQHVLGVPIDADDLAGTGILSDMSVDAVRREVDRTDPGPTEDVAIGAYLTDHFDRELVDHLVGPLIGGINAGDVDRLSLDAVTPQLAEAAHTGGSLVRTLRDRRAATAATGPVFHGLRGGTGTLVDALVDALRERGAVLVTEAEVRELRSEDDGSTVVVTAAQTFSARGVVLAVPADVAANLIEPTCPDAAEDLGRIEYTSVTLVTFVFRRDDVPGPLDGSGFLVPRDAGLFLTAASWGSSKWAHWDDGRHVILRVSAGHSGDRRVEQLDDDDVARRLLADLRTTMGIDAPPVTIRVSPWPRGFAQYHVGHLDRVDRIEQALARDLPQVRVTGAAYRGLGIPACITQGRRAARDLLATPLG